MNPYILTDKVQQFINDNLGKKIEKIIFAGSPFKEVNIQELADQITSKIKCKTKLPSWFQTPLIYYPKKINIEQTSSETAANYKSRLISGNSLLDITGGFGVDSYYFSKQIKQITHCEINRHLSKIVANNYEKLAIKNIKIIATDGLKYLEQGTKQYDCIYLDPSRRNDVKGKVFLLKDCLPNIPENLDLLFEHTSNLLIKISPLLDITSIINELKYVKEIHVVAVKNEVKELLILLERNYNDIIDIKAINIYNEKNEVFKAEFKNNHKSTFAMPLSYLYEPNNAILKAGLYNEVSHQLHVFKLHNNSHLYTCNELIEFPGRRFKIKDVIPFDTKILKTKIPSKKANITTRNFPLTVAQIRKKTGLKDGGENYIFCTTNLINKLVLLLCKKV